MDFHAVLQKAVDREDGALAQRALIGRVLSALGHREPPEQQRTPQGVVATWKGTPAGDVVLSGGKVSGGEAIAPAPTPAPISRGLVLPRAGWRRIQAALGSLDLDAYPTAELESLAPEDRQIVEALAKHLLHTMESQGSTLEDQDVSQELAALAQEVGIDLNLAQGI